jgi:hypothetical protein
MDLINFHTIHISDNYFWVFFITHPKHACWWKNKNFQSRFSIYKIFSFSELRGLRANGTVHDSKPYQGTNYDVCITRKHLILIITPCFFLLGSMLITWTPGIYFSVDPTPHGTYPNNCLGRSLGVLFSLNLPKKRCFGLLLLIIFNNFLISVELEDYPDSPVNTAALTPEAASSILDSDDTADAMDTEISPSGSTARGEPGFPGASCSTQVTSRSDNVLQEVDDRTVLTLPPIYHTVAKKKLAKMMVRNLNGCAHHETDGTNLSALVSTSYRLVPS